MNTTPILINDLGMLYPTEKSKNKRRFGIYKCQCGSEFKANSYAINTGAIKSCGCHNLSMKTKHNLVRHRLYATWNNMLSRCLNKNSVAFKYYGERGIKVCDRWMDINNFIDDMYPTFKEGFTLDRKDTNGNYEPSNCQWSNKTIQMRTTRRINSKNTSGYRGVSFYKTCKKWRASIRTSETKKHLGLFSTAIEAAIAYDTFVIENNLEHTRNGVVL